jgi:dolichol kinase
MLNIAACLFGVYALLVLGDMLAKKKLLKDEYRRKFIHITVGCFVAFWPWVMSFEAIRIIGLMMLAVVFINRRRVFFKFSRDTKRISYGDYLFAVAITLCALLTTNKLFFAIAILHMALADGLAAIIGQQFGKPWKYLVFSQTKTLLGSMTFWLVSIYILGIGLLAAHNYLSFNSYALLLLVLPPLMTLVENFSLKGADNILVPVGVILALNLAQL